MPSVSVNGALKFLRIQSHTISHSHPPPLGMNEALQITMTVHFDG